MEDFHTAIKLLTEGKLSNVERSKHVRTLFIIVRFYIWQAFFLLNHLFLFLARHTKNDSLFRN